MIAKGAEIKWAEYFPGYSSTSLHMDYSEFSML